MAILLHSLARETTLTRFSGRKCGLLRGSRDWLRRARSRYCPLGKLCNPLGDTLGHVGANASDCLCPDRRRSGHCSARILQFRRAERVGLFPNYNEIRGFA